MRKRRLTWVLVLVVAAGLGLLAWWPPSPEPVYQEKKLSEWIDLVVFSSNTGAYDSNAVLAVRAIGSNAVPWLLKESAAHDSWMKRKVIALTQSQKWLNISIRTDEERSLLALNGFHVLGFRARPALPVLLNRLNNPDSALEASYIFVTITENLLANVVSSATDESRRDAEMIEAMRRDVLVAGLNASTNSQGPIRLAGVKILAEGHVDAGIAVPALIRALQDPHFVIRLTAAQGLGRKTSLPVPAIPPLIASLNDLEAAVRRQAAQSLGNYFRQAKTAVPALLKARADPDPDVREAVKVALDRIDPETAALIPDLPDFKPLPPTTPPPISEPTIPSPQ